MAFSLNEIHLIGNVGSKPEHKEFDGGGSVTTFSLATSHSYKKKGTEDYENVTTWHRIKAFGLNSFMLESIKKGAKFFVKGRLEKRDYESREGEKRLSVDVIVTNTYEGLIPLYDVKSREQDPDEPLPPRDPIPTTPQDDDLPF